MGEDQDATASQWEYKVVTFKNPDAGYGNALQDQLNRLGADGWELISITTTVKHWVNVTGNDLVFVFKRPGVGSWTEQPWDSEVPW